MAKPDLHFCDMATQLAKDASGGYRKHLLDTLAGYQRALQQQAVPMALKDPFLKLHRAMQNAQTILTAYNH